jgi:hypothetical protein
VLSGRVSRSRAWRVAHKPNGRLGSAGLSAAGDLPDGTRAARLSHRPAAAHGRAIRLNARRAAAAEPAITPASVARTRRTPRAAGRSCSRLWPGFCQDEDS